MRRDDGVGQVPRRRDHFVQHAVGPHADFEFVLERLEVDVAGLVLDRQQQHHVEQLADGGRVGQFLDATPGRTPLASVSSSSSSVVERADDVFDAVLLVGVVPGDGLLRRPCRFETAPRTS